MKNRLLWWGLMLLLGVQQSIARDTEMIHEKDNARMHLVPAGEYIMGTPEEVSRSDESPAHAVRLDPFYLDQFEVTNAQYEQFMAETDHPAPLFWEDLQLNQPDYPVVGVTWDDAKAYADWAGKRLPTEAEWEIAARGSDPREFPWGNAFDEDVDGETIHANIAGDVDGFELTAPVGSFPTGASEFGVHDMAGNVMEWVADWYDPEYYKESPVANPTGPISGLGRVLRGGSWGDMPDEVRSAKRRSLLANLADRTIGFRCALDTPEEPTQGNAPWDVDNNGTVNILDLVLVGSNFGNPNATAGDVDGNGRVDIFDLVLVANHFGERTDASPQVRSLQAPALNFDALPRLHAALAALESAPHLSAEIRRVFEHLRRWVANYHARPITRTQLFANYPNPFNPETWIPFQLAHAAEVTIQIYDVTGKRIRQLNLGDLEPGIYTMREQSAYWNGRDASGDAVASGIYFYRLRAGAFQATRRMLLLK
ncbi:MAG: SUMF1/EgtB/PvdO family nonheme iron enzyme [Candidatus Poribacteria bacterium]|nr:SUMF1/EgtB/PvdO family nonheme iron enzyme [Candidatus Poribacteria bacterium]